VDTYRHLMQQRDVSWDLLTKEEKKTMMTNCVLAHEVVRDDAGDVGTAAHDILEEYVNKWIETGIRPPDIRVFKKEDTDSRSVASARAGEAMFNKYHIVPIATELLVGDEHKEKTAGQIDLLGLWDNNLAIIDYKTSNSVMDDYAMQVAEYAYLFWRMTGIRIKHAYLTQFSKRDNRYNIFTIPNLRAAHQAFLGSGKLYNWNHNGQVKVKPLRATKEIKL